MKFIALKTDDGKTKGRISFYCKALGVSRQSFYDYLNNKDKPWKYEPLAAMMLDIIDEDEYNTAYGGKRMQEALELKKENKHIDIEIPKLRTIYRIMESLGLTHRPNRNPHGITKADKDARKSDDLLKRDFTSDKPNEKAVTDITECKCKDGKIYVSALFDCFDSAILGICIEDNMRAEICSDTIENAVCRYPELRGAIIHSDRGSQYTSAKYRITLEKYEIRQSMNSARGRCHDNARCESMWARMKVEMFYNRRDKPENYTMEELKVRIWRYFMSYWNNRRICSANGGLPPMVKRERYYKSLCEAA